MKKLTWVLCLTLGIFMLAGCGTDDKDNNNQDDNSDTMVTTETVVLYFGERDKHALVKEDRSIMALTDNDVEARAKVLMEELVKGPTESRGSAILPTDTKITSVKVANGVATVDMADDSLSKYDAAVMEPEITADAIVATLTRLDGIDKVKLVANGKALKLGTMEFADELTVDAALQQNIDEQDGKVNNGGGDNVIDEMLEDGKDVVDDMVEGGKDVVDDMVDGGRNVVNDVKNTGKDMVRDEKEMLQDGKNAVKNDLGINDKQQD